MKTFMRAGLREQSLKQFHRLKIRIHLEDSKDGWR